MRFYELTDIVTNLDTTYYDVTIDEENYFVKVKNKYKVLVPNTVNIDNDTYSCNTFKVIKSLIYINGTKLNLKLHQISHLFFQ